MFDKTEIHRKHGYAFTEIHNSKQMFKIRFSRSHHISAEARIEKIHYKTGIHQKSAYASAEIQNPKQMPKILVQYICALSGEGLSRFTKLADEGSQKGSKPVQQGPTKKTDFPRKSGWKSGFAGWLRMLRKACNNKPRFRHNQIARCLFRVLCGFRVYSCLLLRMSIMCVSCLFRVYLVY